MGKPNIVSDSLRAAAQKHSGRVITCDCGTRCRGNGGWSSHKRACKVFQALRDTRLAFERVRIESYLTKGHGRGEAVALARRACPTE